MPAGAGDKLEKAQKKWLESVWAIMLPEEERFYKDLKKDERNALAFRLGQLVYQRTEVEHAYEDARSRARNL